MTSRNAERRRLAQCVAIAVAAAPCATACASRPTSAAAETTAADFCDAIARSDGAAACDLLAPVGVALFNQEQLAAGFGLITLGEYVTTSAFAVDVTENWQSEFLQFLLYIVATVFFLQRGSPESKPLDQAGRESDTDQTVAEFSTPDSPGWARVRGWRLRVYSRSLSLVMGTIFFLSWLSQSITGAVAYSEEQMRDLQDPVTWTEYLRLPDFWSRTAEAGRSCERPEPRPTRACT